MNIVNLFKAAILSTLLVLMPGCASLSNDVQAKLIVSYATLKTIEQNHDHAATREKIVEIVSKAEGILDGAEAVTLDLVEVAVRAEIAKLNLSPADALIAEALIVTVSSDLQQKLGSVDSPLKPEQVVLVKTVLSWIKDAAASYMG